MSLIFVLEIIGTIAFAASGALIAINKKMDILGVAILGMTTAVGGGIIRDLILDITPPAAFRDPVYALLAIAVSIVLFLPSVRKVIHRHQLGYDRLMLLMDSIGLGIFTVVGVRAAFYSQVPDNAFLAVFVGVVTGVGGGVMRDVFAGDLPYIFVKHFYACASIIGAVLCVLLWQPCGETLAVILGAAVVCVLRLLAATYRWSLPKAS